MTIGDIVLKRLRTLQQQFPIIGEVRGVGAMIAMEFVKNGDPHQPDADFTRALAQKAATRGLVILSCGLYSNVIRFLAPLTIPEDQLREGLDIIEALLRESAS